MRFFHAITMAGECSGGVADHGHDDHPHEHLRHAPCLRRLLHAAGENLAHPRNQGGGHGQHPNAAAPPRVRPAGLSLPARRQPPKKAAVSHQQEDQMSGINGEHNGGDLQAQIVLHLGRGARHMMKKRGHYQRDRREDQQRRLSPRRQPLKTLCPVADPSNQHGEAGHQQNVADDRSRQRSFHHVVQPALQCGDGIDQLGRIAEGRAQQPAHTLARVRGQVPGCVAKPSCQRKDRQTRRDENSPVGRRAKPLERRCDGHEEQKPVQGGFQSHGPRAAVRIRQTPALVAPSPGGAVPPCRTRDILHSWTPAAPCAWLCCSGS